MTPETFENTFAPAIDRERLNIDQIIAAMSVGGIKPADLPTDVKEALDTEIKRREQDQMTRYMMLILLLGTTGEIKYKTRLQKYLFLADKQFVKQTGRKPNKLVYDWKPYKFGPFSYSLGICVDEAVKNKTVEVFKIQEDNKNEGIGYRLTIKGRANFGAMLKTWGETSKLIHGMLNKFQKDPTEHQLLEFVYKTHPEYTTESEIRERFNKPSDVI